MGKIMRIVFICFVLLQQLVYAQEYHAPSPKIGWDSLRSSIQYPPMLLRAGHRTALTATIQVDTFGVLKSIAYDTYMSWFSINNVNYHCSLTPADSMFCQAVTVACQNIEWNPGTIDGIKKSMEVSIPFVFIFYSSDTPPSDRKIIIKEVLRPKIQRSEMH